MNDLGFTTGEYKDRLRQLEHSELARVTNIDWTSKPLFGVHHFDHGID